MAFSTPAVVTQVTGRAWIRNSDGSLTELHAGSRIPPDTEIVTASGATVALQTEGGMPLTIGENRDVAFNADMAGQPVDRSEAAVAPPTGTDSDRLLAALQSGQDPFDNLEPTAALVSGGGDGGGSSFVRLARVVEATTPLDLAYPNPGTPGINLVPSAGLATGADDGAVANNAPLAADDANTTSEKLAISGNILTNDSDPDGDALAIVTVGDRPMVTGGVTVPGSNGGAFTVFPDGSYVFEPGQAFQNLGAGQTATSSLTYTITDPAGNTSTATITVTVNGVNDAPTVTTSLDNINGVDAQQNINVDVSGHFADVDNGDKLTYSAIGLPPGLQIDPNTGVITGTIDHSASQGGNQGAYQVVITATDTSGASVSETFTWNVSNPAPVAANDTAVTHEDAAVTGNVLTGNEQGAGRDVDPDGDTLQVVRAGDRDVPAEGVKVTGTDGGTFTIHPDGSYTFEPGEDFQGLAEGETKTTTITYTVSDGEGGTSTATLEVTVTGTNDVPVITPHVPTGPDDQIAGDHGTVVEDEKLSVEGKLDISDADHDQSFFQAQEGTAGKYGTFTIDANGKWTYQLNNSAAEVQQLAVGEHLTEEFTVKTADGTETKITVTIDGTNDVPEISGESTGAITEDADTSVSGQLAVADTDKSDTHTWSIDGSNKGAYGAIAVDEKGQWTYTVDQNAVQALKAGETVNETFTVLVDDGNGGKDTQVITITLTGTNDAPIITPHVPTGPDDQIAGDHGTVVEDEKLSVEGKLDISDADRGESSFQPQDGTAGKYGTFTIDANGKWTYQLNNSAAEVQQLAVGEHLTEEFTVKTADGTETKIIVTIDGTNDVPEISGESTGAITEDADTSVSGQLAVADTDKSDTHTWSIDGSNKGAYGAIAVDEKGQWTYTVDQNAVQALKAGETVNETFTVLVDDGNGGKDTQVIMITLTGTNDAPIITPHVPTGPDDQIAGDHGTVVEDEKLSVEGKLDISDADRGESSFQPQDGTAGKYGTFTIDANGKWTYQLNNSAAEVQQLAVGEHLTEEFTVKTADGTETKITVTIDGTNDKPEISGPSTGSVQEDGDQVTSGQLTVADVDVNDHHTWSIDGDGNGAYGKLTLDSTGKWTYTLDNEKAQSLTSKDTVTETFTVKVSDGHGGFDDQVITVTVKGTDDGAVIQPSKPGDDAGTVTEDKVLTAGGKLDVTDPDAGQAVFVPQTNKQGQYGSFTIDANGNWTYKLDNTSEKVQGLQAGQQVSEKFTVTTADGTTSEVTITINGTNDQPQISGPSTGSVQEDGTQTTGGQLAVQDADIGDQHTWSIDGDGNGAYGKLTLDSTGKWTYTLDNDKAQSLTSKDTITETFTVKVSDGHGGFDDQVITVTVKGTDDGAVIQPSKPGDDAGTVTEDKVLTAGGKLDVTDPDAGQAVFVPQTNKQGQYGSFTIDANGNWTYKLDNTSEKVQGLQAGQQVSEKFTVTTADGTTSEVTITINGTNDQPQISGPSTGSVQEDGTQTTGGQLAVQDADIGDQHTWSIDGDGNGAYGKLTLDSTGKWTYTLDNDKAQSLTSKDTVTETFTVKVSDGHGGFDDQVITVTVKGTDDGAVIQPSKPGDDAGTVTEDKVLTAGGKLDVTDPDAGQAVFVPQTNKQGQYGSFTIDANGNWTYKLDNTSEKVQGLQAGQQVSEKFTVTTADGTTSEVTITINGTNDQPQISGPSTGSVQEDGTQTTGGQLAVQDADIGDQHTWSIDGDGNGAYGKLTLDSTGKWTYTLDNDKAQSLTSKDTITETFTVKVSDGHGGFDDQVITVTVKGTDDRAVITGSGTGSVTEDSTLQTGGKLNVLDPDAGQAVFVPQTNHQGQYGSFTIDANGNWTYRLNNDSAAVQALGGADKVTETFTVTTADGTTSTVTVVVNGANDAPTSADNAATVDAGGKHTFSLDEFAFQDSNGEHDSLQSVIITRTPDSGTLTLNGQTVTAGQEILASDIAAGKLVYTPGADGKDASFGFQVRDNGGDLNGGHDTSGEYTFDLVTNNLIVGGNTGSGGSTPLNGGSGDDIIVGDEGGTKVVVEPGKNYNIALIVDHSGSMAWGLDGSRNPGRGEDRMSVVKAALINLLNTLDTHTGGVVNVALIGFGSDADRVIQVQGLTANNVDTLIAAINRMTATGGTNYEDAFDSAVSWFNAQAAAGKTGANYENISYFLTDGDPTYYVNSRGGRGGDGSTTDDTVLKESIDAFKDLSNVSNVHAIGVGDGVSSQFLQFFDNTNGTGNVTVGVGYHSDTTLANFTSNSGMSSVSNWAQVLGGSGSSLTRSNGQLHIMDVAGSGETKVTSQSFNISGSKTSVSFDVSTTNFGTGDSFKWAIEKLVDGQWVTVQSGTSSTAISNMVTLESNILASGTYHLVFSVTDNTSGNGNAQVNIDNIATHTYSDTVSGPAGNVDIVHQGSDLDTVLQGGGSHSDPVAVGSDTINGGDGHDIIFGDTINTDGLSWAGHGAGTHDGQGWQALVDYLTATNGHTPTTSELYGFISANHGQFNVDGDTRGGNDVIHGGNGDDIIYGQGGDDQLYGDAGNDIIYGGEGNDLLHGGAGNDTLYGGNGNDTLIGGQGNDTLYGGAGSDTFKWELNDQGTVDAPAVDTIKDFSTASKADGGDVLDLHELLQNPADGDLSKYLHFSKQGNDTVINVSTTGHAAANAFDQKIVLQNVDLTNGGALQTDQAIINDLLQKGKLQGHNN
ncbi:retention module-containing protein [Bordetella genomosp. 9]|uniref:Retention module-containing protein n=1 Tax=Bordetella genomosp. 9 TaxID=1416803 RepID=A0A1W6Z1C8_9BORD|nr:retention module-containing protein [Bordetella genomosp. 9]ARP86994.1 hypothetical protein CAL13_12805 [Bordetella genomosp. 9]